MGEQDRKLRVVEVPAVTLDTLCDNVAATQKALRKAELDREVWHNAWLDLLNAVGDLYHRAKGRPKGRRFATVLELENLLRVDDDQPEAPRPTVQVMDGETGEDGGMTSKGTPADTWATAECALLCEEDGRRCWSFANPCLAPTPRAP